MATGIDTLVAQIAELGAGEASQIPAMVHAAWVSGSISDAEAAEVLQTYSTQIAGGYPQSSDWGQGVVSSWSGEKPAKGGPPAEAPSTAEPPVGKEKGEAAAPLKSPDSSFGGGSSGGSGASGSFGPAAGSGAASPVVGPTGGALPGEVMGPLDRAGVPTGTGDARDFWERMGFAEEDPGAAWARRYGLPAVPGNPYEAWVQKQLAPSFAGWAAKATTDFLGGRTPATYQSVLSGGDLRGGYQNALESLRAMKGLGNDAQGAWLASVGAEGGPEFSNILEAGLRGRGAPGFVARTLAKRAPGYEQAWRASTMGGAEPGDTMLDYVLKKLGF